MSAAQARVPGSQTAHIPRDHPAMEVLALTALLAAAISLLLGPALFAGRVLLPADLNYYDDVWRAFAPVGFEGAQNDLLSDQILQYYPWRNFCHQAARHSGEIPLWNPYVFAGAPFLANAQSAPLSPINWLGYLIPPAAFFAWAGVLRLYLAGLFTYFFMRSNGAGKAASLVAALAYAFCGPMVVWLSHPNTDVFLWLPAVLWALQRALISSRRAAWLAVLALLVGIQGLAGHFQSYFHALVVTAGYAAFKLFCLHRLDRWRAAAGITVALGAGIALSAVQALPFAEFLLESGTLAAGGRTSLGAMDRWWYSPRAGPEMAAAVTLVIPDFYGNPATHDYFWPFRTYQNYNEQATYVGTVPLFLALVAARRPRRRELHFFIGLAIFSIAVASRLPLFEAINHLPIFSIILNKRLRFVFSFCLAVLAGWGADRLFASAGERADLLRYARLAATVTAVLALTLGGCYFFVYSMRLGLVAPRWPDAVRQWLFAVFRLSRVRTYLPLLVAVSATAWLYMQARRRLSPSLLIFAILLLTGAELLALGYRYYPTVPSAQLFPDTPALNYLHRQPQPLRILAASNALIPNRAMATGLPEIGGFDLPVSRRIANLYRALGGSGSIHNQRWNPEWPLLELWGVQYVIGSGRLPADRYELVYDGEVRIHRARHPMPRVFSVSNVEVVPDEAQALQRVLNPAFDYRRTAVAEAEPGILTTPDYVPAEELHLVRYEPNHVTVKGHFPGPGFVVLADAYDDDWQATVNGQQARIYPSDYLLRGVAVPPGDHTIEFAYHPPAYRLGLAMTLLALAVIGCLLALDCLHNGPHRTRRCRHDTTTSGPPLWS